MPDELTLGTGEHLHLPNARIAHFRMLARYNRRGNERLYAACARLSEVELKRQRPAFFGSIHD